MALFNSLMEIVEQLRWCNYECEAGSLQDNIAFRELEQMANEQNRRTTMAPIEMIKGSERQTLYSEEKVSLALADGWQRVSDLSPERQADLRNRPPMPFAGYDDMTAHEVLAQANGLPPDRVKEVITYESATKGRVSIIGKLTGTSTTFMQGMPRRAVTEEQPPQTIETVIERPLQTTETVEIVDGGKGE